MTKAEIIADIEKIIRDYQQSIGKSDGEIRAFRQADSETKEYIRSEWNGARLACDVIVSRILKYGEGGS